MGFRSALFVLGIAAATIHGSSQVANQNDRLAAGLTTVLSASGAMAEQSETATGALSTSIGASADLQESGSRISAVATILPRGFRSLVALPIAASTLAITGLNASAALLDNDGAITSTVGPGVLLTSINTTSDWRITATPDLIVGDRIEVVSATGGPVSDITINADGTFTLAPGSTVSSFSIRVWSITDQEWGNPATQFLNVLGAADINERGDVLQSFAGPVIGATATLNERQDTASGAGVLTLGFIGTIRDAQDGLSAAIATAIAAAADLREDKESLAATGALSMSISVAAQDLPDLLSSLSGTPQGVIDAVLREDAESCSGDGVLAVVMAGSLQEQADLLAADIALPVSITSAVLDVGDGLVSVLVVARSAESSLLEGEAQLLADMAIAVVADFAGLDRESILKSGATLVLAENAGGFVATLVVPDRLFTLSLAQRSFTLSPSTGKKS